MPRGVVPSYWPIFPGGHPHVHESITVPEKGPDLIAAEIVLDIVIPDERDAGELPLLRPGRRARRNHRERKRQRSNDACSHVRDRNYTVTS